MPNRKTPGRDAFETERKAVIKELPSGYGLLLQNRRPDLNIQHIYHVKAGKALDWDVLDEMKKLIKDTNSNRQKAQLATT